MSSQVECSNEFLDSIKSVGLPNVKYNAIIDLVDQQYHKNTLSSEDPIPEISKVILKMIRMANGKKLDNFSDNFLVKLMDIDPSREELYSVLELINKTYNKSQTNELSSTFKNN